MKFRALINPSIIVFSLILSSCRQGILWERIYDEYADNHVIDMKSTMDGRYIIVGLMKFGNEKNEWSNIYLLKLDAMGNTLWEKTIQEGRSNGAGTVQQTPDGGYIVAGGLYSGNTWKLWLLKTDEKGSSLWSKTYESDNNPEIAMGVEQTSNGGYILAGQRVNTQPWDQKITVMETDARGNTVWKRMHTLLIWEMFVFRKTSDGGYIMAGRDFGSRNYLGAHIVKMNHYGDTVWTKTYGKEGPTWATDIQQTKDGGFIIVGRASSSPKGVSSFYIAKVDGIGELIWEKSIGSLFFDSEAISITQTTDNRYVIVGDTKTLFFSDNVKVIKTDDQGNILEERTLHTWTNATANVVVASQDGGFVIGGKIKRKQTDGLSTSYFLKLISK